MTHHRHAGVLLHPTSLPSRFGIGDFGPSAYAFVDFLAQARQSYWQVLPLVIPDIVGSPYASSSAFAGNWLLISPERLAADGLLDAVPEPWSIADSPVHYRDVARRKRSLLQKSWRYFQEHGSLAHRKQFVRFKQRERFWINTYALFSALKEHFGDDVPWTQWPRSIRQHRDESLAVWRERLSDVIDFHQYAQWIFDIQWKRLRRYARQRSVSIIGDVPYYITRDSAVTWSRPRHFMLDRLGRPRLVGGVPPDYFSSRGQVWGDPLYNWDAMAADGFAWWIQRFRRTFDLYDIARLDHFRGFSAVWGVRAKSRSARHGSWHQVPGRELFMKVQRTFPHAQFIAEDLGVITNEVNDLRNALQFPGVRVAQFGFDNLGSIHTMSNWSRRCVAYTGTHDNNTTRGWFNEDATRLEKKRVKSILHANETTVAWKMIAAAYTSRAETVIVPLQDIANRGSDARLNTPGTREGNWQWRCVPNDFSDAKAKRLRALAVQTKRRP